MNLQQCATARGLAGHLKVGLQALGSESSKVQVSPGDQATHSLNLDAAIRQQYPNSPRWDFGIGISRGMRHRVAWVEIHPATSGEVQAVINKLNWLRDWISQDPACTGTVSYHWVATNAGVHIDTARQRRLAAAGLTMPRRNVTV